MKRIIKDYQSVNSDHLKMIAGEYPDGFGIDDLITFRKPDGTSFRGLEIRTEEAIYLFKINTKMLEVIDDYTDEGFALSEFSDSSEYEFDNSEDASDDEKDGDEEDDD